MTFKPNQPMSEEKAQLAISLYKDLVFATGTRAWRVFSERRVESRKIKLWNLSSSNFWILARLFDDFEIPFYTTDYHSIAFNVPLDITMSGKVRS